MAPVHERQRHPLAVSMLSALLGTASVASAGIYPGHLDPGGTGLVPAFNADVLFSVDSACIGSGTGWQQTPAPGSSPCGPAAMTAAAVYLYGLNDPSAPYPPDSTLKDTLHFSGFAPLIGVYFVNGVLTEVDSDPIDLGFGSASGPYSNFHFFLEFISGNCTLGEGCPLGPPLAQVEVEDPGSDPGFLIVNNNFSNPATVTIGPQCTAAPCQLPAFGVPEPATLSLLAGALGMGWFTRRRRAACNN